jgi:hypothetical protein
LKTSSFGGSFIFLPERRLVMSTQSVDLPLVASGIGAGADVSYLGAVKTVSGVGISGNLAIEISDDNVNFCPIAALTNGKQTVTFTAVSKYMRVNASSGGSGGSVQVIGERSSSKFVEIPAPPAGGSGPSVNISAFGEITTVIAGAITGGIGVEISADDVNFSPIMKTFLAPGACETEVVSAKYIRSVSQGGTGPMWVGAEDPGGDAFDQSGIHQLVWRPGATGDNAPGGNVYTGTGVDGFLEFYKAYEALKNRGTVELHFDSRYSPDFDGDGNRTCLIPLPPAGIDRWNFRGAKWVWNSPGNTFITLSDGHDYLLPPPVMQGWGLFVNYAGQSGSPCVNFGSLRLAGPIVRIYTTDAAAKPVLLCDGGFFDFVLDGESMLNGLGKNFGFAASLPAPAMSAVNGGFIFSACGGGQIVDNAMATDGHPWSFIVIAARDDAFNNGDPNLGKQEYDYPGISSGQLGMNFWQRDRCRVESYVLNGPLKYGVTALCDPSDQGDFDVHLPKASISTDRQEIVVTAAGAAGFDTITVKVQSGDKLNGTVDGTLALTGALSGASLRADGKGGWWVIP